MTRGASGGISLNRINLNLLKVLAEICEVRSVTIAGENLGLSQSAVSHALGQLRQLFGDDLFIRTRDGMVPTPLAADIGERLPKALIGLEAAIAARRFVASETAHTFHIACSDYTMSVFLPRLLGVLEREAPGIRLTVASLGDRLIEQLDTGKLDLVIAGVREAPDQLVFETLFSETNVWVHRCGHPLAGRRLGGSAARRLRTVMVDYRIGTDHDPNASFASRRGLTQWTRTTAGDLSVTGEQALSAHVVVPNFFTAASLVAQSDLAAQLPARLAALLAPRFELAVRDDWPVLSGGFLSQIWHRGHGDEPSRIWLRETVRRCAVELDAGELVG